MQNLLLILINTKTIVNMTIHLIEMRICSPKSVFGVPSVMLELVNYPIIINPRLDSGNSNHNFTKTVGLLTTSTLSKFGM